jgi:hypothetical protein
MTDDRSSSNHAGNDKTSHSSNSESYKDQLREETEELAKEYKEQMNDESTSTVNVDADNIHVDADTVTSKGESSKRRGRTVEADHVNHSSSGSHKLDMDLFGSSANWMMFLAIALHLADKFFFSTSLATTPLRLSLYVLFAFLSYLILESGENGLSARQAVIEYTAVTAIAVFLFPVINVIITSLPGVGLVDFIREYLAFLKLAIMPWPIYYITIRGMNQTIHKDGPAKIGAYLTTPVKWPKVFYAVLTISLVLYVLTTMPLQEQAARLDQNLPATSALRAGTGFTVLTDVVTTGAAGFYNDTRDLIQGNVNQAQEFIRDPLGSGYQAEVEDNRLGVEVSVEPWYDGQGGTRTVQEGDDFNFQNSIQYSSEQGLPANITVVCELLNQRGDIVRSKTIQGRTLGGSNTNSYVETCTFNNMSTINDRQTSYTARMSIVFPFRTQATTEYYFASASLQDTQPARYDSQVDTLDADEADAQTTAGPIKLATANDRINMPVTVSEDTGKLFPYGFNLQSRQGEIVNITWVEMAIPSYFTVQEGPTCQIDQDQSLDPLRQPKDGYQKIIFDDYLTLNQNDQPYAACNILYDESSYGDLIFSQDTIQPVTFSVTAEYNYKQSIEQRLTVEPRVLAQQNQTGGTNEARTA